MTRVDVHATPRQYAHYVYMYALSCDGGVVEDECYQLLLAPEDT